MDIPESMRAELARWSDDGSLEEWLGLQSQFFALAIGYATIFWPEFESVEGYILRKGFDLGTLRHFEASAGATRQSVEWMLNHIHLWDLQALPDHDGSPDKFIALGHVLADIYRTKLAWQFPDKPCEVEFYVPDNREHLTDYQISFWQVGEPIPVSRNS